jgi:alkylhydroperoxidase family enzyme
MPRIPEGGPARSPFYAILQNRPEVAAAWAGLDDALLRHGVLPAALKEEVRAAIASGVGCKYCASVGGERPTEQPDERTSLALAFADLVVQNHGELDDATFDVLRGAFTDEEIVELAAWVCFKFGGNVLGALMRLDPATAEQTAAYRSVLDGSAEVH